MNFHKNSQTSRTLEFKAAICSFEFEVIDRIERNVDSCKVYIVSLHCKP